MRGPDPAHPPIFVKSLSQRDCRVEPGNDTGYLGRFVVPIKN
jgi:hypothetical protein